MDGRIVRLLQKVLAHRDEANAVDQIRQAVASSGVVEHGFFSSAFREMRPRQVPSIFGAQPEPGTVLEGEYRLLNEPHSPVTEGEKENEDVGIR